MLFVLWLRKSNASLSKLFRIDCLELPFSRYSSWVEMSL